MTSPTQTLQRIAALTPLDAILSRLDALVSAVAASDIPPAAAIGATLAADVAVPADVPGQSLALHDGWAVASEQVADANSYSPAIFSSAPVWVDAGQRMPTGTDAILPVDAVVITNGTAEAHASVAIGEGVLPASANAAKGMIACRAGERLRAIDAAALLALGIETIKLRLPRVKIVSVSQLGTNPDTIAPVIASAVRASGGAPEIVESGSLDSVLSKPDVDAIITIGGTGTGKNDSAVRSLARLGSVACHGFGISPGQTSALGSVDGCPVLVLPGRLDAALAVFLVAGKRLMDRLTGLNEKEAAIPVLLSKKITSTIGLAEVVFVRRVEAGVEPLGNGMFPLQTLMQADGWILVSAASEGSPAGTNADMRALP